MISISFNGIKYTPVSGRTFKSHRLLHAAVKGELVPFHELTLACPLSARK